MYPINLQPYIIRARKRPLRIAHLLDARTAKPTDVDELLWNCLRSWGGRHWPILLFDERGLAEDAWDLLRAVSPEIIFSPTALPEELSQRLRDDLSVAAIQSRGLLLSSVPATINPQVLEQLRPTSRSKTSVTFRLLPGLADPNARRFIEWNFGPFVPATANGVGTREHSVGSLDDLRSALQTQADFKGHCAYQPEVASVPDTLPFLPGRSDYFTVVVGDSIADFCAAWNAGLCKGHGGLLSSLWIPLTLVDGATAPFLKRWIEHAATRLGGAARILLQHPADPSRVESLAPLLLRPHCPRQTTPAPTPEPEGFFDVFRASEIVHRGLQDREAIVLRPPESWHTTGSWAADLVIEQETIDRHYIRTWWWQLPRSAAVAERTLYGRVNSAHRLPTALVQADRPEFSLRLLDAAELFRTILCPLRGAQGGRGGFKDCRTSDKGRYLESFVEILGGFMEAGRIVESRFWRSVLEDMPEVTSAPETEWTFKDLLGRAYREFNAFARANARSDTLDRESFQGSVENLIERGVFVLGMDQRCASCGYRTWFALGQLRQTTECPGCHLLTPVDPSRHIGIRLNSLVKRGVTHDIAPVLLALSSELMHSRTSFRYAPQTEVFDEYPGRDPLTDIDILCITDGDLVIGEAKTSVAGFSDKDFANLRMCAERLRPDRIVLFSMNGDASPGFTAEVAALKSDSARHGVRETVWLRPSPGIFEATPPH